jgi:hypothetical protein
MTSERKRGAAVNVVCRVPCSSKGAGGIGTDLRVELPHSVGVIEHNKMRERRRLVDALNDLQKVPEELKSICSCGRQRKAAAACCCWQLR